MPKDGHCQAVTSGNPDTAKQAPDTPETDLNASESQTRAKRGGDDSASVEQDETRDADREPKAQEATRMSLVPFIEAWESATDEQRHLALALLKETLPTDLVRALLNLDERRDG